jgi:hypothetical protein
MSDRRGQSESPDPAGTDAGGGPTVIDVTPTPGAEPDRRRGGRGVAAIGALATLVVALAASPYWAPPIASILPWGGTPEGKTPTVDTTALEAKLSALEARLAGFTQGQQRVGALEQRIAQLEQRPAAAAPNPRDAQQAQALSALSDRLAALEQRTTTLAAANSSQAAADATKGLQADVQALSQKLGEQSQLLAKLQSQEASGGADRTDAALVVAAGQLRAALQTSRPYAAELQAVEALARDQPDTLAELRKLDGRAQQGVPTLATLTQQFPALAQRAARASAPAVADDSWRARALAKLKGLVTVRRVGDRSAAEPDGSDAGLAAAAAALGNGDLAGAVAAARRLEGPAAQAVAPWLQDAQARLDAEASLAALDATLMRRFLANPAAGAKP